jgi:hypothetical protein
MECLIELHLLAHQPGKAIQYYLKLRKPGVFDLIRDNNLFTDIQDQALLLVDFEMDMQRRSTKEADPKAAGNTAKEHGIGRHGEAIDLLVNHTHSIPVSVFSGLHTSI